MALSDLGAYLQSRPWAHSEPTEFELSISEAQEFASLKLP